MDKPVIVIPVAHAKHACTAGIHMSAAKPLSLSGSRSFKRAIARQRDDKNCAIKGAYG